MFHTPVNDACAPLRAATFIYGSYAGQITFYEPMIKREYLAAGAKFCRALGRMPVYAVGECGSTCMCNNSTVTMTHVSLQGH